MTKFTIKVPMGTIEELIDATGKLYSTIEPRAVYFDREGNIEIEFLGEEVTE